MNRKTTFVLLLACGGLFAYIYFFDAKRPSTQEAATRSALVLGKLDRDQVGLLQVTGTNSRLELRREPGPAGTGAPRPEGSADERPTQKTAAAAAGRWRLVAPVADRADAAAVSQLLYDLTELRKEATIAVPGAAADPAKLSAYGLQNPHLRLRVGAQPGGPPGESELLFGNDTPVQGRAYVQVAGRDEVYAVSDALRKELEKGADPFRDHQVTELTQAEVGRLTLKNATGTLELVRDGEHWRMLKPQAARASDQQLNALVARLVDLKAEKFVADRQADLSAYGLAEPRGRLVLASRDDPARQTEVIIGKPTEETAGPAAVPPRPAAAPAAATAASPEPADGAGTVYVRVAGRPDVLVVPRSVDDFLRQKPDDLRDHQLVRLNPDLVDRIRVRDAAGEEVVLDRTRDRTSAGAPPAGAGDPGAGGGWTWRRGGGPPAGRSAAESGSAAGPGTTPQPADRSAVDRLLQRLTSQTVGGFVADTAADLAKYGLDQPALRVGLLSVASENTAESNAGEKAVATIDFGATNGPNVYARLEEEPFVVAVPRTLLEVVSADPLSWQEREVYRFDPARLQSLSVQRADQPPLAVRRTSEPAVPAVPPPPVGAGATPGSVPSSAPAPTAARSVAAWTLASPSPAPDGKVPGESTLNATRVQSLANTLARLRAFRWVGAPKEGYGLGKPFVTINFQKEGSPAEEGKLVLGGPGPDGTRYARAEGKEGVFLVSRPDFTTLAAPLFGAAQDAPLPTTSPSPGAEEADLPGADGSPAPSPVPPPPPAGED